MGDVGPCGQGAERDDHQRGCRTAGEGGDEQGQENADAQCQHQYPLRAAVQSAALNVRREAAPELLRLGPAGRLRRRQRDLRHGRWAPGRPQPVAADTQGRGHPYRAQCEERPEHDHTADHDGQHRQRDVRAPESSGLRWRRRRRRSGGGDRVMLFDDIAPKPQRDEHLLAGAAQLRGVRQDVLLGERLGDALVHVGQLVGRLHLDELTACVINDGLQVSSVKARAGQANGEHANPGCLRGRSGVGHRCGACRVSTVGQKHDRPRGHVLRGELLAGIDDRIPQRRLVGWRDRAERILERRRIRREGMDEVGGLREPDHLCARPARFVVDERLCGGYRCGQRPAAHAVAAVDQDRNAEGAAVLRHEPQLGYDREAVLRDLEIRRVCPRRQRDDELPSWKLRQWRQRHAEAHRAGRR